MSVKISYAKTIVERTQLMEWLLKRMLTKEDDANKYYSCEILSVLLQSAPETHSKLSELQGIDA